MNVRDVIIAHAVWSGAGALIPLPFVDDLFAAQVRKAMLRRLCKNRGVAVDDAVIKLLAGSGLTVKKAVATFGLRRAVKRIALPLRIWQQSDDMMRTFQLGVLFDHCLQRAGGIDLVAAERLLLATQAAAKVARGQALERSVRGALKKTGSLALAVPRRFWKRDKQLARPPASPPASIKGRMAQFMSTQAASAEQAYSNLLREAFDRAWQKT